jgi:hypothetical protein
MPHNQHIWPANQVDALTVPTPGRMQELDQRASEGVNAIDGGDYAPEKKIWIGGQGVELSETTAQLKATIETGPQSAGLILGAARYPILNHADSKKKTVVVHLLDAYRARDPIVEGMAYARNPHGLTCTKNEIAQVTFNVHLPQLRIHNGATIVAARLWMRYANKPSVASINGSGAGGTVYGTTFARLIRYPTTGNVLLPPASGTNDFDLYLTPAFQASHAYALNDITLADATVIRQYRCVTAGTSGASVAGWSTTICDDITSNTAHFLVEPRSAFSITGDKHHYATVPYAATFADTVISHFNNGLPFALNLKPNRLTVIDTDSWVYMIEAIAPGLMGAVYHSIEFDLDLIDTMKEP